MLTGQELTAVVAAAAASPVACKLMDIVAADREEPAEEKMVS
jgi:hypothetical protein